MVEKRITSSKIVIDLANYRQDRASREATSIRLCRHCGALLSEGEKEDDCSSASNIVAPRLRQTSRRFRAD